MSNSNNINNDLLKILIKNEVKFSFYRAGVLYYRAFDDGGNIYLFPVPIEDTGDSSMLARDKGLLFMRWIRKAMESGTLQRIW